MAPVECSEGSYSRYLFPLIPDIFALDHKEKRFPTGRVDLTNHCFYSQLTARKV